MCWPSTVIGCVISSGLSVLSTSLEAFARYIDFDFGLLKGEVAFLATTLAAIDMTLAALFWAWSGGEEIIARIVFESFAGLGLKASGAGLSTADFLRPGRVAQVGIDASRPILESISALIGYVSFFKNFIQIAVLLLAGSRCCSPSSSSRAGRSARHQWGGVPRGMVRSRSLSSRISEAVSPKASPEWAKKRLIRTKPSARVEPAGRTR